MNNKLKKNNSIKKEYINTHKGKGKNYKSNVELRQQELINLLGQGIDLKTISTILQVSIDTIYDDKKQIALRGYDNLKSLGSKELGFYYSTIASDLNNVKKFLWSIINSDGIKNEDPSQVVTIDHKLKASRTIRELNTELREVYNKTVESILIPEYTKRLENIESLLVNEGLGPTQQDNNQDNKQSFMVLKRPNLTSQQSNNDNMNNNKDNKDNINNGL